MIFHEMIGGQHKQRRVLAVAGERCKRTDRDRRRGVASAWLQDHQMPVS